MDEDKKGEDQELTEQELRESNVYAGDEEVLEKKIKDNIKYRENCYNILEQEVLGQEDGQMVPENI